MVVSIVFILALSAPASPSAASSTQHATLLESIQQQLNEIIAAVARVQARLVELLEEAAQSPIADTGSLPPSAVLPAETASAPLPVEESTVVPTAPSGPVWTFLELPSTYLAQPLSVLYKFSITGGAEDAVIPSVTFVYQIADVSVKNLEVFAFSDEFYTLPAFLRNTAADRNRVGRYVGYLDPGLSELTILFDQGPPSVIIPAGKTYYFELRGTVVGKNTAAFLNIAAKGLPEVMLK